VQRRLHYFPAVDLKKNAVDKFVDRTNGTLDPT
jgi:hypothetical protein